MKKSLLLVFIFSQIILYGEKKDIVEETRDIRKYHEQLEEKVFELEDDEELEEKLEEAFSHGKRRIKDLKKNQEAKLEELEDIYDEKLKKELEEKYEEVKIMEEKYGKILEELEDITEEKKKLIEENEYYKNKLNEL